MDLRNLAFAPFSVSNPIGPYACQMANMLLSRLNSTKDKLILEEAYSINPKPDKQARLEIVNRVSLNEKEVQVCRLPALPSIGSC